MKHKRLYSLLLTLALFATFCFPAMAGDNWWEEYVSSPSSDWSIADEDGTVTSTGDYLLFTSDCHRYTYLIRDLLAAANDIIDGGGEEGNVGLIAFGGDFADEKVLYDDNMSILQAAIASSEGTVATYTKGNHEGNVSDEDFEALTGMSRVGETAINADGDYYFYNFGAYNSTSQFREEDIEALDEYLSTHTDKPVFLVSHYPIHYYNDHRNTRNAAKLVEVLNQYPNVVFLWGHNHTERDPNYGMIRLPGDTIQTGADASTTVEINFTYACLGALRDGVNGSSGLLAKVDGSTVIFRYMNLNSSITEDTWTDAQGNENAVRVSGTPTITSETVVDTAADNTIITLANLQIDQPQVGNTPAETASAYSPRFTAGALSWSAAGSPVTGTFGFETAYTTTLTLTAQEGYTFSQNAVVSVNKAYVGPMPGQENHEAQVTVSQDGKTAQVAYTFDALYPSFTDVSGWSTDDIYTAAAKGLMLGTSETTFAPTDTMTRAMAITVLYRLAGSPAVEGTSEFSDVAQDYYTDAVIWGAENGIVLGCEDGLFRPDTAVSRQEFATLIARYISKAGLEIGQEQTVSFTDEDSIQSYAQDAVALCASAGILCGYPDGSVQPANAITREEAAAMLVRLMDAAE
jgi:hypothetical protein